MKLNSLVLILITLMFSAWPHKSQAQTLAQKLNGRILLQVENNGEAYYVYQNHRYYLANGDAAYQAMRQLGQGISNENLNKIKSGEKKLRQRFQGQILLQVENNGEAYYIANNGQTEYLKDGVAAYQLLRKYGLGIKNSDLNQIPLKKLNLIINDDKVNVDSPANTVPEVKNTVASAPANLDLMEIQNYWLQKINDLRLARNLRLLTLDQRLVDTAQEWSNYMAQINSGTHNRPDGKTMHQWIDAKKMPFTNRNSPGGWKTNYFTENISWSQGEITTEGVKKMLDESLAFYLSEAPSNGPHYRTIYHTDWNSFGLGLQKSSSNKVYFAFHYGSLNKPE